MPSGATHVLRGRVYGLGTHMNFWRFDTYLERESQPARQEVSFCLARMSAEGGPEIWLHQAVLSLAKSPVLKCVTRFDWPAAQSVNTLSSARSVGEHTPACALLCRVGGSAAPSSHGRFSLNIRQII